MKLNPRLNRKLWLWLLPPACFVLFILLPLWYCDYGYYYSPLSSVVREFIGELSLVFLFWGLLLWFWLLIEPWVEKKTAGHNAGIRFYYLEAAYFAVPLIFFLLGQYLPQNLASDCYYWGLTRQGEIKIGICDPPYNTRENYRINRIRDKVQGYLAEHDGKMAEVRNAQDYFYWISMLSPEERNIPVIIYSDVDRDPAYPSSILANPRLGGKAKAWGVPSALPPDPACTRLVIMRERNYYHFGNSAWYWLGDGTLRLLTRKQALDWQLDDSPFPPGDYYLFYGQFYIFWFWLLFSVLLLGLGYWLIPKKNRKKGMIGLNTRKSKKECLI